MAGRPGLNLGLTRTLQRFFEAVCTLTTPISRLLPRRAERKTPTAAYAAEQRGNGHFNLAQLLVITLFGVWGIVGFVALVPMAMFLISTLLA
ncbi:TPA: hypothetical protein UN085_000730 [Stenotrophomonas maltophilia]|nr:hypothetical protein [Stenotrophomonas maltophilia]HEL3637751.1 hypothetical protein [Stenotrophomonas maltophilia]HEL3798265.1 hypothetical protein [Stenotrophomonas maltophilia]HEL3830093.1 hypothetical protein [Stenotrophomonas maltophilia]HEL4132106.1 hypothetical protein [Stenotrophomonas maltophilia]